MSRAEIFRVIDVGEAPEPPAGEEEPPRRKPETLALWTASPDGGPTVSLAAPAPTLAIQNTPVPDVLDPRLVLLAEPASARARSYRLLRHRLLALGDPKVVTVTSAHPGEGKTTAAVNLALALAEDTMVRVLLIEANLRRPAIGQMLGFEPADSVVHNITRFADVGPPYPVVSITGTRVHVAALPLAPAPAARLDRMLFAVVLNDLRAAYDYIVVDAASVLESADADVASECASGVLFATRAGASRKGDVRRAIDQVKPARVLGSVLIDA